MNGPPPPPPPLPPSPASNSLANSMSPPCCALLVTVVVLVLAADLLSYGVPPGPGLACFFGLLWIGLRLHRPRSDAGWKEFLLVGMMATSAVQIVIEPSFSNWLVLILLTFYASGHFLHRALGPFWCRALQGMLGIFSLAATWSEYRRSLREARKSGSGSLFAGKFEQALRWGKILLPASLLSLLYLVLFGNGNAVMGDGIGRSLTEVSGWLRELRWPSAGRFVFWWVLGLGLLALLGRAPLSPLTSRIEQCLAARWSLPADTSASIWSTRILLVAVNLIFFAANSVDVFYLWMGEGLPEGVVFSEFVHEGVYNIIACVVLAAGILLVLFQQSRKVTHAPGQKVLATAWIVQNLLLVSSVVLRLKMYVDAYYLSLLRLYLAVFLVLVVVGFLLLAVKLGQDRKLLWLVNANFLAVFVVFFTMQFLNDRAFVARFNFHQATRPDPGAVKLDVAYLNQLGPAAWPVLRRTADHPKLFGVLSEEAAECLRGAVRREKIRLAASDWRSWQWRRSEARRSLPGGLTLASDFANHLQAGISQKTSPAQSAQRARR